MIQNEKQRKFFAKRKQHLIHYLSNDQMWSFTNNLFYLTTIISLTRYAFLYSVLILCLTSITASYLRKLEPYDVTCKFKLKNNDTEL